MTTFAPPDHLGKGRLLGSTLRTLPVTPPSNTLCGAPVMHLPALAVGRKCIFHGFGSGWNETMYCWNIGSPRIARGPKSVSLSDGITVGRQADTWVVAGCRAICKMLSPTSLVGTSPSMWTMYTLGGRLNNCAPDGPSMANSRFGRASTPSQCCPILCFSTSCMMASTVARGNINTLVPESTMAAQRFPSQPTVLSPILMPVSPTPQCTLPITLASTASAGDAPPWNAGSLSNKYPGASFRP
mmetsp:Transcript_51997/g.114052  ORF Transcript_51997/g.114052 Transcript_51997/m.114052 type:complete len:242 (+) Transcript_51997:47-772(+)